jgi:hypothetical protein
MDPKNLNFNDPKGIADLHKNLLSAGAGSSDKSGAGEKLLDEMVRSSLADMKSASSSGEGVAEVPVAESNFKAAVDQGSFDLRGWVGQQWALHKKGAAAAADYKACGRTYAAQRTFRQDWAKAQYDTMVIERTKTTTQRTSFGSFGRQCRMFG